MSRWKDQISEHPIFAAIDQCKEWIETGLENRPEDADPQVEIEARRLLKILSAIRSTIIEMDAEFVPKPIVDSLDTHLRNAGHWNQLTAFSTNSELSSIQNANNHIDSQLNSVSVLLSASASLASPRADLIEDRYDSFVEKSSTQLKNLSEAVSKSTDMTAATSERMHRAAEELDGLEESFQKKLNDWNTAFTERSNGRSEEFNDAQISRKKESEALLSALSNRGDERLKEVFDTWETTSKERHERLQKKLGEIKSDSEKRHLAIREIHGLLANDGGAGGYKTIADEEAKKADNWRLGAIAFIVATVLWLMVSYFQGISSEQDLGVIATHFIKALSLTGVLLFGAAFASRQSNVHRDAEQRTRRFALETQALDPFIQSLPEEKQHELIEKFSERFFGQEFKPHPNTIDLPSSTSGLVEVIRDALSKIPGQK